VVCRLRRRNRVLPPVRGKLRPEGDESGRILQPENEGGVGLRIELHHHRFCRRRRRGGPPLPCGLLGGRSHQLGMWRRREAGMDRDSHVMPRGFGRQRDAVGPIRPRGLPNLPERRARQLDRVNRRRKAQLGGTAPSAGLPAASGSGCHEKGNGADPEHGRSGTRSRGSSGDDFFFQRQIPASHDGEKHGQYLGIAQVYFEESLHHNGQDHSDGAM
jgi:hypothetical protein